MPSEGNNGDRGRGARTHFERIAVKHGQLKTRRLWECCGGIMNYLLDSGWTINGVPYGSSLLFQEPENLVELHRQVAMRYYDAYKERFPFSNPDVAIAYEAQRKAKYRIFRDGKQVPRDHLPLFKDDVDDSCPKPVSTIYAYWGCNQNVHRRLIKIGYTGQNLQRYLSSLKRQHDPKLLSSKCGDEPQERREHHRWRDLLYEGREWFRPDEELIQYLRTWNMDKDFEAVAKAALDDERERHAPQS